MFGKDKSKPAASQPSAPPPVVEKTVPPSIIASNLTIIGNLDSSGDIQVDGQVDGDIKSGQVTIGEGAVVNGSITGDDVVISGTVNGQITAMKIRLTASARVTGDINHDTIAIEAGAYIQGLCRRVDLPAKDGASFVAAKQIKSVSSPETTAATG